MFPDRVSHGTCDRQNGALYRPNQQALASSQPINLSAARLTRLAPAAEVLAVVQQQVVGAFSEPGACAVYDILHAGEGVWCIANVDWAAGSEICE
jgi:hypothetical protein